MNLSGHDWGRWQRATGVTVAGPGEDTTEAACSPHDRGDVSLRKRAVGAWHGDPAAQCFAIDPDRAYKEAERGVGTIAPARQPERRLSYAMQEMTDRLPTATHGSACLSGAKPATTKGWLTCRRCRQRRPTV
jgi:hypothetical protein